MVTSEFKTKVLPVSSKLLSFASLFLKDKEKARDVVQDVFLKLWQNRMELDHIENMEAFALRMTRNRCIDVIRGSRVLLIDEQLEWKLEKETVDTHKQYEINETVSNVKKLINSLPELQRRVMQLRDIDQLEYDEIAKITGLKINAIRVNLSRARKKVRDDLIKMNSDGKK